MTVNDGTDPIEGATVTIGESSETTDSSGVVEFELAYDDYEATISAEGYTTKTESIAFRNNHKNFTIALESSSQTGTVTITVLKNSDDSPMEGVSVTLYDDENSTTEIAGGLTNEIGVAILETIQLSTDIPFGNYYLYIGEDGYTEYNEAFTVDGDETATIKLTSE